MIKVSLIMPVYNAETYLSKTLDCILKQQLREIEVILVDDGSKDKSGMICDEYAKKDSRIKVFHQNNKGMCSARNFAMSKAQGEYIAFADNDDLFTEDFLSANYEYAKKNNADIVKFGRRTEYFDEKNQDLGGDTRSYSNDLYDRDKIIKNYFELQRNGVLTAVWDGLYRKKILDECNVKFYEEFQYGMEDTIFCRQLVCYADILALHEGCYYYHFVRESYSASSKFNSKLLEKYKIAGKLEQKVWKKLKIENSGDGGKELDIVKDYLIPALFKLGEKKCDFTYFEKRKYLKELQNMKCFKMNLNIKKIRKMIKINKKQTVISMLFVFRMYGLLLFFSRIYLQIVYINRKKDRGEGAI